MLTRMTASYVIRMVRSDGGDEEPKEMVPLRAMPDARMPNRRVAAAILLLPRGERIVNASRRRRREFASQQATQ